MALYLYDDAIARTFEPFALTRPVSELRAGAEVIRRRWARAVRHPRGRVHRRGAPRRLRRARCAIGVWRSDPRRQHHRERARGSSRWSTPSEARVSGCAMASLPRCASHTTSMRRALPMVASISRRSLRWTRPRSASRAAGCTKCGTSSANSSRSSTRTRARSARRCRSSPTVRT